MNWQITFQRSHRFQCTNSGTNSVLNRSNSAPPFLTPPLTRPTNSPTLTLASSKPNPVSFFTDSPSFVQNRSEPRRTDWVRISHENPSDPFGFEEARTRKKYLWREFPSLCLFGSLKRKELLEVCVSSGAETRSGFGLHGMVRSISGCRSERSEFKQSSNVYLFCACICCWALWFYNFIELVV